MTYEHSKYDMNQTNKKALRVLLLAVFIDLLGFGLVLPFLPFWIKDIIHESELMLGILLASFSAMQFLCAPLWGRLSDRIGRRPVILLGLTGTIIGFSILTITAILFLDSLFLLFLSRVISGIGTSATLPTSQAYISDSTSGSDRVRSFGLIGAAFAVGFAIGPAIGAVFNLLGEALVPNFVGYWAPCLFGTILALINLFMARSNLPETFSKEKREVAQIERIEREISIYALVKTKGNLLAIVLIAFISSLAVLGFSSFEATIVFFGEKRIQLTDEIAGIILTVIGVSGIFIQGVLIRPLSKRASETTLIVIGTSISAIGFLGVITVLNLESMMFWIIFVALGIFLTFPTTGALLSKQIPPEVQGTIMGLNSSLRSLMRVIGPIFGTFLFTVSEELPYLIASILFVGSLLIVFFLIQNQKKSGLKHLDKVRT